MKTECPYCHQAVEVAEENINREVQCPACQKEFTASEEKLCPTCGLANPAQAATCRRCRYAFVGPDNRRYEPSSMFTALRRYADFSGRSTRREYWLFVLLNVLILGVFCIFPAVFKSAWMVIVWVCLGELYFLGFWLPSIAVSVRRLHDVGYSGWYFLVALIPFGGPFVLLIWAFFNSQPGSNRYGDNPKGVESSEHYRFRPWIGWVGGMLIGFLLLFPVMFIPALSHARAAAQAIRCVNNMKRIGLALKIYAEASGDWLPPQLDNAILKQGNGGNIMLSDNVFVCPVNMERYVYIGGGLKDDGSDEDLPILFDVFGSHRRDHGVLFMDGHVERVSGNFTTCEEMAQYLLRREGVNNDVPPAKRILENARAADLERDLSRME